MNKKGWLFKTGISLKIRLIINNNIIIIKNINNYNKLNYHQLLDSQRTQN